jgi:hypothetical protein
LLAKWRRRRQAGPCRIGQLGNIAPDRACWADYKGRGKEERQDAADPPRSLEETAQARFGGTPHLREGVDARLSGDLGTGKAILRDFIHATIGFEALSAATGTPPKSLLRLCGPRGNPQAGNLLPC